MAIASENSVVTIGTDGVSPCDCERRDQDREAPADGRLCAGARQCAANVSGIPRTSLVTLPPSPHALGAHSDKDTRLRSPRTQLRWALAVAGVRLVDRLSCLCYGFSKKTYVFRWRTRGAQGAARTWRRREGVRAPWVGLSHGYQTASEHAIFCDGVPT